MAAYQKKYLTLSVASVITGYTVAELRNFCKIGLVPNRKYKNRTLIRFDAFEKLNTQNSAPAPAQKKQPRAVTPLPSATTSLLPFTTPNRQLVAVLQAVALAAILAMVLYLVSAPRTAERVVGVLFAPVETVAFMADSTEELIATSLDIGVVALDFSQATLNYAAYQSAALVTESFEVSSFALTVSESTLDQMGGETAELIAQAYTLSSGVLEKVASTPLYVSHPLEDIHAARVAGVVTQGPAQDEESSEVAGSAGWLISVAAGADQFQRAVSGADTRAFNALIDALRFETLDEAIQATFRW